MPIGRGKLLDWMFGVIMLGGLGWLLVQVYTMNGDLHSLNATETATAQRLDRVVAFIPDVRVKIAQVEIAKPIEVAVVTMKPAEESPGKWISSVHIIDRAAQDQRTFTVQLSGPDDPKVGYIVSGIANKKDSTAVSFHELEGLSAELGKRDRGPTFAESDYSYCLHAADGDKLSMEFSKVFGPGVRQMRASLKSGSWSEFSKDLASREKEYRSEHNR